jgi:hypothetical protein
MATLEVQEDKIIFFLLFYKEGVSEQIDYVCGLSKVTRQKSGSPRIKSLTINSDLEKRLSSSHVVYCVLLPSNVPKACMAQANRALIHS